MPKQVSLDQIMAERAFTVRNTQGGDTLFKLYKSPASWNKEQRSARFVMTAEVVDRYGDVVVAKGVDIGEFEKNPIALWAHDNRSFPVGTWESISRVNGTPKRIEGTCVFSPEGTTPETDTLARLVEAGTVRACSIGFMPKSWESIKDDKDRWTGYRFLESELLECSPCNVPANAAALVKAAGGDDRSALQAIELILDEWSLTPEGLIVPRKSFEDAYVVTRNADKTIHEVRTIEEEDEDATAPVLTNLDIEAAVSRGVEKVADGIAAKFAEMFGLKKKEIPVVTEIGDATVEIGTIELALDEDEGETEDEFQARLLAEKAAEPELADEAEELALLARAAEMA